MPELTLIETAREAADFIDWISSSNKPIALDTETSGLSWQENFLRMAQFGDTEQAYALACPDWLGVVREAIDKHSHKFILHNHKFDAHFLREARCALPRANREDTLTLAKLNAPAKSGALKELIREYEPEYALGQQDLRDAMDENKWSWETVPQALPQYWQYAALDCIMTARVYDALRPYTHESLYDIEMASQYAIEHMEERGLMVDQSHLLKAEVALKKYAQSLLEWADTHYSVRLTSRVQLEGVLIDSGWVPTAFTKKGAVSLDKDALSTCDHPLAQVALDYRHSIKMANTYCASLREKSKSSGRIHPTINPNGAHTGRMTMSNPNLQQLPRNALIRSAFMASPGYSLILCDYDQMEARIVARETKDPGLIKACMGEDLHSEMAKMIWPDGAVTPARRQLTKNVTYAIMYGSGASTLGRTAGIAEEYAESLLNAYKAQFPGVVALYQRMRDEAMDAGDGLVEIRTPMGRRQQVNKGSEWKLVNYLVQGSGADSLKAAIARIWQSDLGEYLRLPVHDELVLEAPTKDAWEIAREIEKLMHEDGEPPLPATAAVVSVWGEKYAEDTSGFLKGKANE